MTLLGGVDSDVNQVAQIKGRGANLIAQSKFINKLLDGKSPS